MTMTMAMTTPRTAAGIDRIARALGERRSRRGALALLAAGVAVAARPGAAPAAEECGCADGEICIGGICSVIVEDSCEALGCGKGFRCVRGACVQVPKRKKSRNGR